MRWVLTGPRSLKASEDVPLKPGAGFRRLRVLYCGICRTDAKMWHQGHRDLVLPRVPGHEIVGVDGDGKRFAVWPGDACGSCRFCRSGRENLCEHMQITGFHRDGGFARHVRVPETSLVPVPEGVPDHLGCFAEPAGCAWHALEKIKPRRGMRMIIYGGGTLGLLTAMVARSWGVESLVIEKSTAKTEIIRPFLDAAGVRCKQRCDETGFDLALNACADPVALESCLERLGKGGKLCFFSGLSPDGYLPTGALNRLHYREVALYGSYGLRRRDMTAALEWIQAHPHLFEKLLAGIAPPARVSALMPEILRGESLRYLLDFTG